MFFDKIYTADIDEVSPEIVDSFLMCGNKNWDHYFTKEDKKIEMQELQNVTFIEFNEHKQFIDFIKDLNYIDFSLENNRFGVLYHAKD